MKDEQIQSLLQQASNLQDRMQEEQDKLERQEVVGASGGGMVEIVMNGRHDVSDVRISEQLMDDREILEDMIAGAVNDAARKIDRLSQEAMENMTGTFPGMDFLSLTK